MEEARKVAKAEGVAVDQLISVALAEKVSALRTEDYFAEAEAGEGGRSEGTDVEGVRLAISRRIRQGEPAEAERIAAKETVLRVHLAKAFGDKRLDEISTEDVQRLKAALVERAPKTVNNILTTLSVVLKTAVEWGVIERVPCSIKLLKAPKGDASFHDFEEFERLVEAR
jgi:hypothetical protein